MAEKSLPQIDVKHTQAIAARFQHERLDGQARLWAALSQTAETDRIRGCGDVEDCVEWKVVPRDTSMDCVVGLTPLSFHSDGTRWVEHSVQTCGGDAERFQLN